MVLWTTNGLYARCPSVRFTLGQQVEPIKRKTGFKRTLLVNKQALVAVDLARMCSKEQVFTLVSLLGLVGLKDVGTC